MAVFVINDKEANTLQEAFALCREIFSESKAEAVLEQRRAALAKPSQIDIERAAAGGVQADMSRANAQASN